MMHATQKVNIKTHGGGLTPRLSRLRVEIIDRWDKAIRDVREIDMPEKVEDDLRRMAG